ncbi:MAG: hypothetical protein R2873_34495 [Caldilineaceae bacterium]
MSDDGVVTAVQLMGVAATLSGNTFNATVPLSGGNQLLTAVATDNEGAVGKASRVVTRDSAGPQVTINAPKDRQSVYTYQPEINIAFSDIAAGINPQSSRVVLTSNNGASVDVTSNLDSESNLGDRQRKQLPSPVTPATQ